MITVQNIDLGFFTSVVIPVDLKSSQAQLVARILENITDKKKKPRLFLVSIVKDLSEFDLNRLMLMLDEIKKTFLKEGFTVSAEMIRITKGEDTLAEVITEYAMRNSSTILYDKNFVQHNNIKTENSSSVILI